MAEVFCLPSQVGLEANMLSLSSLKITGSHLFQDLVHNASTICLLCDVFTPLFSVIYSQGPASCAVHLTYIMHQGPWTCVVRPWCGDAYERCRAVTFPKVYGRCLGVGLMCLLQGSFEKVCWLWLVVKGAAEIAAKTAQNSNSIFVD